MQAIGRADVDLLIGGIEILDSAATASCRRSRRSGTCCRLACPRNSRTGRRRTDPSCSRRTACPSWRDAGTAVHRRVAKRRQSGSSGNAGLNTALRPNASVTSASRNVYDAPKRKPAPIAASADSSTPCASNDAELMYAPKSVAAATSGGTPAATSCVRLRNSSRFSNVLLK